MTARRSWSFREPCALLRARLLGLPTFEAAHEGLRAVHACVERVDCMTELAWCKFGIFVWAWRHKSTRQCDTVPLCVYGTTVRMRYHYVTR